MKILDKIMRDEREFITKMYGITPNRVMLTMADADALKEEIKSISLYQNSDPTYDHRCYVRGMRVVVDEWAQGVEVGYVR